MQTGEWRGYSPQPYDFTGNHLSKAPRLTVAHRLLNYYKALALEARLPKGVQVMNPYKDPSIIGLCRTFYEKYYADEHPRVLMLGINPGRFGGGATGIAFTDPIRLAAECHIPNELPKKPELSSDFIYRVVNAFGGPEKFYGRVLIGSVCPLGFTKDGKNLNYYDDKKLTAACLPFIISSINDLKKISRSPVVFCLGEGQNFKMLQRLNDEHHFFDEVRPLPHPRFILQYRRKKVEEYVQRYVMALSSARSWILR